MSSVSRCPKCGRELEGVGPAELCSACLLEAGLAGSEGRASAAQGQTTPFEAKFAVPSLAELAPHFPQLELLEQLGQGGMGAVYKARQLRLDRFVALKILPKSTDQAEEFANRFAREARAMARLSHPNIVNIHDYGETGGWFFFIMEFVDGVNLRQAIRGKTVEPKEALTIVGQVCDALQYAHEEGVVHRDIKPENILLDKKGRVKIADFGLAKLMGQNTSIRNLTATNQVMGTLGYMAPEQMEGSREVDQRADIFSLGVVFYELLTGELPMGRFALPSQKVQVDVRIDEVVLKTLEKEPERRYQFASQVKEDVERITNPNVSSMYAHPRVDFVHYVLIPLGYALAGFVGLFLVALLLISMFASNAASPRVADNWTSMTLAFIGFGLPTVLFVLVLRWWSHRRRVSTGEPYGSQINKGPVLAIPRNDKQTFDRMTRIVGTTLTIASVAGMATYSMLQSRGSMNPTISIVRGLSGWFLVALTGYFLGMITGVLMVSRRQRKLAVIGSIFMMLFVPVGSFRDNSGSGIEIVAVIIVILLGLWALFTLLNQKSPWSDEVIQVTKKSEPDNISVWWKEPTAPGVGLLILGLIELLLLFIGFMDLIAKQQPGVNRGPEVWMLLVIAGLSLGAAGVVAGVLMVCRRLHVVAILGALALMLPVIPIGFMVKPVSAAEELSELLKQAQQQRESLDLISGTNTRETEWKLKTRIKDLMDRKPQPEPLFGRWPVLTVGLVAIPLGIWSLLVLFRPEVREQFRWPLWRVLMQGLRSAAPYLFGSSFLGLLICLIALAGCIQWVEVLDVSFDLPFVIPSSYGANFMSYGLGVVGLLVLIAAAFIVQIARVRRPSILVALASLVACLAIGVCCYRFAVVHQSKERLAEHINTFPSGSIFKPNPQSTYAFTQATRAFSSEGPGENTPRFHKDSILELNIQLASGFFVTLWCDLALLLIGSWQLFRCLRVPGHDEATQATHLTIRNSMLGYFSVVLNGIGSALVVWVIVATVRREPLRFPFGGADSPSLAMVWLLAGAGLFLMGIITLVFLLRSMNRHPMDTVGRHAFKGIAVFLVLLALVLMYLTNAVTRQQGFVTGPLPPVISEFSEAMGWSAGFITGGLAALVIGFWPLHWLAKRSVWISALIVLALVAALLIVLY